MKEWTRREFARLAASFGAAHAWAGRMHGEPGAWKERRGVYPEGVASGDPAADSVLLWTRRPLAAGSPARTLAVEVATDRAFGKTVARSEARVSEDSDWTCRVLVGGLQPATEYWYRFTDGEGNGSRIGRTLTAPADDDPRPVRFAFVSCQNANQGYQQAYRRMIYEDRHAKPEDRLGFVLHLGDFIYEIVWYPEDRPQGMYDRKLRDVVRYEHGEKIADFHVPTTVADYRAVYRGYLRDPDLQDARAYFPFVTMWDNHEFSWLGWQGLANFRGPTRPFQSRKVAANQAWFEFHPARVAQPFARTYERFDAPNVVDRPVDHFDEHGLGQERNNLAAIASLKGYRALRWGRNVELIITDQHSYRSEDPLGRTEAKAFTSDDFPEMIPQEAMEALDAGRAANGGNPAAELKFGERAVANFRKNEPAQTVLGQEQKEWFLARLGKSTARWKVWGNTSGTLESRADPQNLPAGLTKAWPGAGYAGFADGDMSNAYTERGEIYDFVRAAGITGFATIAGDRHSFWAGLAAKELPPRKFEPVGIAFITGSISAPGLVEAYEHVLPKEHPLRALFLADRGEGRKPMAAVNLLLRHGVRSCLEYQKSGDGRRAVAASNADLAPHLSFVDMGGHGYSVVRATSQAFEVEFVCIPRPAEATQRPDGGPILYRVAHRAAGWKAGEKPVLERIVLEGDPAAERLA